MTGPHLARTDVGVPRPLQAGLPALADRVALPALLAVDSHHTDERVHHDVAYQLIRGSCWPVVTTIGT